MPNDVHVLRNGDRLGFERYGAGRHKALLFHGFPGSREQGRAAERHCREFDLEVIAFDRPGYGLSEFKTLPTGYRGLARILDEACEDWGWPQVHLISVSGGTPYALGMAASCARVASLNTICGLGPLNELPFRQRFSANFLKLMQVAHATPEFVLNALFKAAGRGDKTLAGYNLSEYMHRHAMRDAFRQGFRGAKLDLANYLGADKIDWASVRCPTTIWHGTNDEIVPPEFAKLFSEKIAHAQLRMVAGQNHYSLPYQCGHVILEKLARVAAITALKSAPKRID